MAIADLPLLDFNTHFTYQGAFKLPPSEQFTTGNDLGGFGNGYKRIAYDYVGNTLYWLAGYGTGQYADANESSISRTSIPTPSLSLSFGAIPIATLLEGPRKVHLGRAKDVPNFGDFEAAANAPPHYRGIMFYEGDLIIAFNEYYDSGGDAPFSHVRVNISLAPLKDATCSGWHASAVTGTPPPGVFQNNTGYLQGATSGYMCRIPPDWRAELGNYEASTGSSNISIIPRASVMPCVAAFNPSAMATSGTGSIPCHFLQHGRVSNPALGWEEVGPVLTPKYFTGVHNEGGLVMIPGSRTYISWSMAPTPSPTTAYWYGGQEGVISPTDPYLAGLPATDTNYGPQSANGYHSTQVTWSGGSWGIGAPTNTGIPMYEYQLTFWDANNLVNVYNGTQVADAARPYQVTKFDPPINPPTRQHLGGMTYDPVNSRLFAVDPGGDNTYGSAPWSYPLVHVWNVSVTGGPVLGENKRPHFLGF